ncbi:hypothetical protein [Mesorhizobium sp. SARCC-RB16n]|uniref:hypothetical protein n=1 Tax=Mesorhizobium sp. SARCC-RB16n TaxID=2116687 RepID=UPI00122FB034|nr:hypothetical protein [Mesorhizobium sp. SARCC-RB16n]
MRIRQIGLYSLALLGLATAVAVVAPTERASAKTCKCEQHHSEATGDGSCSRSESASYCTITFSGTAASSNGFLEFWKASDSEKQFDFATPESAFDNLADYGLKPMAPEALTTIAASSIPPEKVKDFVKPFAELFGRDSPQIKDLVAQFNAIGCVEAKADNLSILIISSRSERNGTCN